MSGNRTGVAGMAGAQGSLNKVVEIILESAALYTIASLIYIPIYATVVSLQTQSNSLVYYEYAQLFWANTAVSGLNYWSAALTATLLFSLVFGPYFDYATCLAWSYPSRMERSIPII
jgi:hypothetical protein